MHSGRNTGPRYLELETLISSNRATASPYLVIKVLYRILWRSTEIRRLFRGGYGSRLSIGPSNLCGMKTLQRDSRSSVTRSLDLNLKMRYQL